MIAPLFLLAAQVGVSLDPRRTYAAGDKDAVFMLPPVAVCDAEVRQMVWTGDGSSLVVRRDVNSATAADVATMAGGRSPDPGTLARLQTKTELVVWSARSHRTQTVASGPSDCLAITEMRALPNSDRILFSTDERSVDADGTRHEVVTISMLAATVGTITRLASTDETKPMVGFDLSPTRPLGYVYELNAATKTRMARFFGPDGRLGNAIALPLRSQVDFNVAGAPFLFLGAERKVKGQPSVFHLQKVDLANGALGAKYDSADIGDLDPSPRTDIPQTASISGTADGARAPSILLKVPGGKTGESGIVTTDGTDGLLSPKGDAVAYVSQGSAVVRPLARVARADYDAALLAARKAIAMSNAKQVALGLIMFAADFDDVFPSQTDYAKVDPYLKDPSLRDSFTYTYAGGKMTDIERPSETEIGYVPGPGGRAVAYSDGHVRWVPDAP